MAEQHRRMALPCRRRSGTRQPVRPRPEPAGHRSASAAGAARRASRPPLPRAAAHLRQVVARAQRPSSCWLWVVVVVTGTITATSTWPTPGCCRRSAELRSPLAHRRRGGAPGVLAHRAGRCTSMWLTNLALLVVFRRWRHLFVWFGRRSWSWSTSPRSWPRRCSGRARSRWRSSGTWSGFSMPSLPMTVLAAFLVSTVYALVPPGARAHDRQVGRSAGLLVVTAASRLYLAQDHPTGILAGRGARRGGPAGGVPAAHARTRSTRCATAAGGPAHLDVTGRARRRDRPRAARPGRGDHRSRSKPFGLAGSGGPRRCGSR